MLKNQVFIRKISKVSSGVHRLSDGGDDRHQAPWEMVDGCTCCILKVKLKYKLQ